MAANIMTVNPGVLAWFENKRGIDAETVLRMGIYSGALVKTGVDKDGHDVFDVVPSATGRIMVYPFLENGKEVNAKYRGENKKFWQKKDGRKTFWNSDVLDDPALISGREALAITEGENDALAGIVSGHPFTVSVPDGAPPGRDKHGNIIEVPDSAAGIDPENDDKYQFIINNWERLKKIKRIIIATDGDDSGRRLAAELVRRLGRVRCYFITYPQDLIVPIPDTDEKRACKDLNEVLLAFGREKVLEILQNARPYPVSGVYRLSEFPEELPIVPVSTGWETLDALIKVYFPCLMVITGFAGAGKSSWANQLAAQLVMLHGWPAAICSFEMQVKPYIVNSLSSAFLRSGNRASWGKAERQRANEWVEQNFTFIAPNPVDDEPHDIMWLIERLEVAVIRYGIRVAVIDPWNEIEHERQPGETTTEYVGRAIKLLKKFMRKFDCLVIIVAHPTKEAAKKRADELTLYDVSDSTHFANKTEIGVVIAQLDGGNTLVIVRKIKYQPDTGRPGKGQLKFDAETELFECIEPGQEQSERHEIDRMADLPF